jgi:hypothetical protein
MAISNWLVVASITGLLLGQPQPGAKGDAYIRALVLQNRLEFILIYAASALTYSGLIKFQEPPRTYLRCPVDGCLPGPLGMLADLRERVPGAYGERVLEPDAAQIEIYVAAPSKDFDRRARQVDKKLHIEAQIGSRFLVPPQPAPCRTTIYFDHKRRVMKKALIFIDQDASPRMQYLCMGFELVRALGVVSIPQPLIYKDLEQRVDHDPLPFLSANVFLHKSNEIRAGASMDEVLAVLKDRYGAE